MKLLLILSIFFSLIAKAELPATVMSDIQTFSKKTLEYKKDLVEVKKVLSWLIELDKEDASRTAVMILSESYNKNKALYDKALSEIENKKNKKQLSEIKKILTNFYTQGNG